jgi:hypothetical protein|tara:strand:- start:2106 stop:3308 length:1203 start_codon:yes stop_codon:yes gene_type:complete
MKTIKQLLEGKDFEPHMMYHPETGAEEKAEKPEDHERLKKKGYTHEKPELDEAVKWSMGDGKPRGGSNIENVRFWDLPKASLEYIQKDSKDAMKANPSNKKNTQGKGNYADQINDAQTVLIWRKKNGIKESVELEEANLAQLKKKHKRHIDAFNKRNKDLPSNVEKELMKFAMDNDNIGDDPDDFDDWLVKNIEEGYTDDIHEEALDLLHENYRTLARKGMGTETKGSIKVGTEIDFYETERGDKLQGKIIKITPTGYVVQAMERGNTKKYTFKWHDRTKAKKLLEVTLFMENFRARRDAMKDMPKQGKDSADDDIEANDDDRKAASKNVLMQIRKASDLPKGGAIEFEGGKKGKISQDDAKKIAKLFDILKKPSDKQKFQKVISKDLRSIQALLKRLGK